MPWSRFQEKVNPAFKKEHLKSFKHFVGVGERDKAVRVKSFL